MNAGQSKLSLWIRAQVRDLIKLAVAAVPIAIGVCVLLAIALAIVFPHRSPPREAQVIHNFETHRASFERLREMMMEDKGLLGLASWGVEMEGAGPRKVAESGFPVARYKEYQALLEEVGGIGASRDHGDPPESVCVWIYASGFAGDTRHMDLCGVTHEPQNQVSSLDEFYKTPKPRKPVYRRVDGNWYLWADW